MATYARSKAPDYSSTQPRQKLLWLEFSEPLADPHDAYFARVLRSVPNPLIAYNLPTAELQPLPSLPIDPNTVRHIVQGQANDGAGLSATTPLIPADSSPSAPTQRFALPLPPGISASSPSLFGFFTYELRVGHTRSTWSTAQGRFGPPLLVNGVQHPPPPLPVNVKREGKGLTVSAPYASSEWRGMVISEGRPAGDVDVVCDLCPGEAG
jgi:hypothetical protein